MTKRYNVLDLFCGCGGLSLGFEMAGFDVKLAIDNWEDALVTYRKNHKGTKTLNADLLNLNPQDVEQEYNIHDIDVIIGGPHARASQLLVNESSMMIGINSISHSCVL